MSAELDLRILRSYVLAVVIGLVIGLVIGYEAAPTKTKTEYSEVTPQACIDALDLNGAAWRAQGDGLFLYWFDEHFDEFAAARDACYASGY